MPFDFKKYDAKCAAMSVDELHLEWQHYTRLISGASTSTAISGIAVPFTLGVSTVGVAVAAPAIHNARKKRAIIEKHLQKLGTTHNTRKRDMLGPMALSSTVGVMTLGVGAMGADVIGQAGVYHGIDVIVQNEMVVKASTHLAVELAVVGAEESHAKAKKAAEAYKHMQTTGCNKPTEAGYSQEQDYGAQIQPPASYEALSQHQAQNLSQYGDPIGPPPAYTYSGYNIASAVAPMSEKSPAYTYQAQYQHSSFPPPQQLNASSYILQSPDPTQQQSLPISQQLEPPGSATPTYADLDSEVSRVTQKYGTLSNTAPISTNTPYPGQNQPFADQQPQQQYGLSTHVTNQYSGQPQYVHGQYLPQPPQPSQQNTQQYQQQYPPIPQKQNAPMSTVPFYSGQHMFQPAPRLNNLPLLALPQQQQIHSLTPPPPTPQTASQNSAPPLQFQNRYETVQPPASYATTPTTMLGSYSGQPTQTIYGYPTPAPTPHAQYPEKSYFSQSQHG
jgi:hypothetical protein